MKEGWATTTLGEMCLIRPPKQEAKSELNGNDEVSFVPMDALGIRQKWFDISQRRALDKVYSGYTYFANGDVLLAKITPCFQNGKLGIAQNLENGVGFGSSEFFVFRCSDQLSPEFLFYFLSQETFTMAGVARMAGAVGHQRVPLEFIQSLELPLPPIPEQERIVALLDEAFAAIAAATVHAEQNLANAQALFDSAVNRAFQKGGDEWTSGKLSSYVKDIATGPFGVVLHKSDYIEGGTPLINPINIKGDSIAPDPRKTIGSETRDRLMDYVVNTGDIVIARRGEIGRCAVVGKAESGWLCGTGCFAIRPSVRLESSLLTHMLRSPMYRKRLLGLSSRATMSSLSNKDLAQLEVDVPPLEEQKALLTRFGSISMKVRQFADQMDDKTTLLSTLKQSLLHKAFTGDLTADQQTADRTLAEAGV